MNVLATSYYENEDNNSYLTANIISLNSSIKGNINYGTFTSDSDIDWYKINTEQTGVLTFRFAHTVDKSSVSRWRVSVYKIEGYDQILLTEEEVWVKDNSISFPSLGLEAGTYYICVSNVQYTTGIEYSITNTFTASSNWETELNDTYSTADILKANSYIEGNLRQGMFSNDKDADIDYYKIDLPSSGRLAITVKHTSENGAEYHDWIVCFYKYYNDTYKELLNAKIGTLDNPYSFPTISLDKGTYYVVVKHYQYARGINYKISNVFECNHSYSSSITKSSTCIATGVKTYICTSCGNSYTEIIPKIGHKYDGGVTTKNPTCTATGVKTYTCTSCGESYSDVIPMAEHDYYISKYVNATCKVKGYQVNTCSVCLNSYTSNFIEALGHDMIWIIDREPTYSTVGYKHKECTKCGYITNINTLINKSVEVTSGEKKDNPATKYPIITVSRPSIKLKNTKGKKVKITFSKLKYSYIGKVDSKTKCEICYAKDRQFKKGKKLKKYEGKLKVTSRTITNLTKKKKYYFKYRVAVKYWDTKANSWKYAYSAWSNIKKIKIKK